MSTVVIAGMGYVGLPLAMRAVEVGHTVLGLDVDATKVAALSAGTSHVEDVTDHRLAAALATGRFSAALSGPTTPETHGPLYRFDIGIITVPTPLRDGQPDLSYVESAGAVLGAALHPVFRAADAAPMPTVVLESTTYPGTTDTLLADVLAAESGLIAGDGFHLGFSPERIDPGSLVHTLENTPKLVSATTENGLIAVIDFYRSIVDTVVPVSSPRVAEITKIFENTQANVNIALINEMAELCHDLGIDVHEVVEASMTKGHSMAAWYPGPGVGGHCLPIDPMYLAWQSRAWFNRPFRFAELADQVNNERPGYTVDRAEVMLDADGLRINGSKVLVLGVAYKPNVGDMRESPAIPVVQRLLHRGAEVTVVDPHVLNWALTPTMPIEDLIDRISEFALVIVITDHREFDYEKISHWAPRVLDTRNVVPAGPNVEAL